MTRYIWEPGGLSVIEVPDTPTPAGRTTQGFQPGWKPNRQDRAENFRREIDSHAGDLLALLADATRYGGVVVPAEVHHAAAQIQRWAGERS